MKRSSSRILCPAALEGACREGKSSPVEVSMFSSLFNVGPERVLFTHEKTGSGKKRIKTVYPVVFSMEPIRINSDSGKNYVN
ncbi:MAG: hypothetical protein GX089_15670 [Fibrobacter sp.]|jgi:hypothetical protein|nr:hypothetical protein [Fibrobacter sp.]